MKFLKQIENKKHIIWDWNGTILNDVEYCVGLMNDLLRENDLKEISSDEYKLLFQFPVKKFYDKLGFNYKKKSFENLCETFVASFIDNLQDCKLFSITVDIISELNSLGYSQSILSATDQVNLDKMINRYDLRGQFDYVYGQGDKLAQSKRKRGFDLLSNSKFGKSESILIGDTLHDLEVGNALEIDVILVSYGHQSKSRLMESHEIVLDCLS